ncbi:MAG: hypothetical protein JO048_15700 [Methylobacteriaceae bacterium]|nr:hypothetical protein [Methylobacteriaceae bacterium]
MGRIEPGTVEPTDLGRDEDATLTGEAGSLPPPVSPFTTTAHRVAAERREKPQGGASESPREADRARN